jgi:hypothetical protein
MVVEWSLTYTRIGRMGVNRTNWTRVAAVLIGAAVWVEVFLRYPLYAVILLAAVGGWWDYMRRRSKLKPR